MTATPPRAAARALALLAALPVLLFAASCSTKPPEETNTPPALTGAPGTSTSGPATDLFLSPRKPEGDVMIQIITNGISPFWDPMVVGMRRAAQELGCTADWAGPQPAEVAAQKRMVEDALSKGADGIAISCIEAEASIPIIDAVLAKNVPVITFDSDSPNSRRLCYIGTSNYAAGQEAGKAAIELLPGGGKIVGFVGNLDAPNGQERRKGFEDAVKGTGIELIDVLADDKDPGRARRNVEDTIAKYGDEVKGFLGFFSYNGPQIAAAVQSAGKRASYKIICFDAEPVTLQELEKGGIDATIVQKPYDFGFLSTKLLYLINRKGWEEARKEMNIPDNGIYDTGTERVTPATVADYKKKLAELGITSS